MTTEEFNKVVEDELSRVEKVLVKKQKEYNLDADRLSVFKTGAAMSGDSPEKVLYGFLLKHLISFRDMVNATDKGEKFTEDLWHEKLTDIHNYLILLMALLKDDDRFKKEEK